MLEPSIKSSLSGTNIARTVFVVILIAVIALYWNALPKPPAADFSVTGFLGADVRVSDTSPSLVQSLRVTSIGGFTGTVTLSMGTIVWPSSGYTGPTGPTAVTITFSSTTVTVPSGSYVSVNVTYWASTAMWSSYFSTTGAAFPTWSLTLSATSGTTTHTYTATTFRVISG
jgi:hypothetical protein